MGSAKNNGARKFGICQTQYKQLDTCRILLIILQRQIMTLKMCFFGHPENLEELANSLAQMGFRQVR